MELSRESKAELRKNLLVTRRRLERERWLEESERVQARIISLPLLRDVMRIHCYVSMEHDREVLTMGLLEWLARERKAVFIPYIEEGSMKAAEYHSGQQFMVSASAPALPDPLVQSEEEHFDLVFVPLVGFDRRGGRIGFGKGWYDRFFSRLADKGIRPLKVGLAFSFQEVKSVPCDPWDELLDMVVTEIETVNCLKNR
jgi:5-formyltetrahydrofolate cyclo-ligase